MKIQSGLELRGVDSNSRYPQLCYNMPVGEHLYITANDIWSAEKGRPLGSIEGPVGQLMVLQSHPVGERA